LIVFASRRFQRFRKVIEITCCRELKAVLEERRSQPQSGPERHQCREEKHDKQLVSQAIHFFLFRSCSRTGPMSSEPCTSVSSRGLRLKTSIRLPRPMLSMPKLLGSLLSLTNSRASQNARSGGSSVTAMDTFSRHHDSAAAADRLVAERAGTAWRVTLNFSS